jgi:hypothetical protein
VQILPPTSNVITTIPDANTVRRQIAERSAELRLLRKLLRVAESRNRLMPLVEQQEVRRG